MDEITLCSHAARITQGLFKDVADKLANGKEPKEARRPAPHNRYRAMFGAPLPGFFWLFATSELVSNKP